MKLGTTDGEENALAGLLLECVLAFVLALGVCALTLWLSALLPGGF